MNVSLSGGLNSITQEEREPARAGDPLNLVELCAVCAYKAKQFAPDAGAEPG